MSGNDTTDAILDNVRAALPGIADDVAVQALYNVCDDLAREALRINAPINVDGDPASWLPDEEWVPNFQALLAGVFASLYSQFGKPYFQPDLAKFNLDRYLTYRTLSRSTAANRLSSTNTIHERLLGAIRAQIAGIRDDAIQLEAFGVVNDIRQEAYNQLPLTGDDQVSGNWLTAEEYEQSYQAVYHGILAGLYAQSNTAWYNLDQSKAHDERYAQELQSIRSVQSAIIPHINTIHERITYSIQAHVPLITVPAIMLVMFGVINDIRLEAYNQPPLTGDNQTPATWLTQTQFEESAQAIQAGMLSRIFGQSAAPWYNLDQQKANYDIYLQELQQIRSVQAAVTGHINTIHERLIFSVQAHVPLITVPAIMLVMFGVANDIRQEAYNQPSLTGDNQTPGTWLTQAQYEESAQALQAGMLSRIFGQSAAVWYNLDQQKANYDIYLQELHQIRSVQSAITGNINTIHERIIFTIRSQIPLLTVPALMLTMFGVINDIRQEVYGKGPLTGDNQTPGTWLTQEEYEQTGRAIQFGMLSRIYGQPSMPWSSPEQQAAQYELYRQEVQLVRSIWASATGNINTVHERIISTIKSQVPLITTSAILLVMFGVCNDIRTEAYGKGPLTGDNQTPGTWLTKEEFEYSAIAIQAGMLARIYGQTSMPWANPEQQAAQYEIYLQELHQVRSVQSAVQGHINTTHERITFTIQSQIPLITVPAIQLVMFGVINDIRDEVYNQLPLTGDDQTPGTWLTQDQYEQSAQAIQTGMLARIYGQTAMPWVNLDQQKAQYEFYLQELQNVRAKYAAIEPHTNTVHERVTYTIRAQIPLITVEALQLTMFGVVNDIRTEVYAKEPLAGADQDIGDWLTTEEFQQTSRAILYGMLSRIYGQAGTPWYNVEQQQAQYELYARELALLRSNYAAVEGNVNTTHERVTFTIRAQIPAVSVKAIQLAMFAVVSELRNDVYKLATLDPATTIGGWLSKEQFDQSSQALLYGTLSRLFGQAAAPWYSVEQSQAQYALYQQELQWLREHEAGSVEMTDTIPERIVASVRAEVPMVSDAGIRLAMFSCIDRLRIEAYRLPPLTGAQTSTTSWFSTVQYEQAFLAIQHGTLYRLYGQAGQPWFNNDLYQAQLVLYQAELISLRMVLAGAVEATDSIPERIVSTVRAQIQLVRDEAVKLEMFNVIQKVRDEAYQLDPLKGPDTNYTTWLTEAQYEESYLAVLYGTLSRLYGQSNMPWFNLDLYGANNVLFLRELDLVRSGNVVAGGGIDGIISEARTYLPGASEEVLQTELRRCMDEFFKTTQTWVGDVAIKVKPGRLVYELDSSVCPGEGQIVRIICLVNSSGMAINWFSMQNIPELVLAFEPSQKDTYTATLCFSLLGPSSCTCAQLTQQCGTSWGVPDWILTRWNEVFFDGLLWRMMMQPAKPYTNTEIGLFHGQRWRAGLADARGAAKQQNVYDGQRWRYPAFA